MTRFVIIGGGAIGLMTTLQLADAGHEVTVVERGECGRESSWAGGGIVSPLYPWRYSTAVSRLARWSEGAYPELVFRLIEETGIDPEYRQKGLLYLRVDDEPRALAWAREVGKPLSRVGSDVIYAREPHACPGVEQALWMPTLGSIRNPRLMQALRARIEAMPTVSIVEHCEVNGLPGDRQRVSAVVTSHGNLVADQVVICGGAWSAGLLALAGLQMPVRPVKGQMLLFKARPGLVERVVLMDGRYVIPRSDGRVLVGSTLEEAGFDKQTDNQARESLKASACAIIPALADYPIEHHWAGLRPGSPDGVPFIGRAPGWDNLFVNAGHYRNGLVLAPASTHLMVDLLLGRSPIIDPEPYALEGRVNSIA